MGAALFGCVSFLVASDVYGVPLHRRFFWVEDQVYRVRVQRILIKAARFGVL